MGRREMGRREMGRREMGRREMGGREMGRREGRHTHFDCSQMFTPVITTIGPIVATEK